MRSAALALILAAGCAQDVTAPGPDDAATLAGADATARDAAIGVDARPGTDAGDDDADATASAMDATGGPDARLPDAAPPLACHVDRFSVCEDAREAMDTNETPFDAFYQNTSSVGCQSSDSFMPGGFGVASRMCPREDADWYSTNFVPCDTITFIAEVRLHPVTPCEAGALRLEVNRKPCTDPTVRCTTDGLDQIVQWEVPPGRTVGSHAIGVIRASPDVRIDYELTYTIRR